MHSNDVHVHACRSWNAREQEGHCNIPIAIILYNRLEHRNEAQSMSMVQPVQTATSPAKYKMIAMHYF